MIMRRVEGESLAPRILRDHRYARARSALAADCGRSLAGLHAIDPASVPGLARDDPLALCRANLDLAGERSPTFELAVRWLEAPVVMERPAPGPTMRGSSAQGGWSHMRKQGADRVQQQHASPRADPSRP